MILLVLLLVLMQDFPWFGKRSFIILYVFFLKLIYFHCRYFIKFALVAFGLVNILSLSLELLDYKSSTNYAENSVQPKRRDLSEQLKLLSESLGRDDMAVVSSSPLSSEQQSSQPSLLRLALASWRDLKVVFVYYFEQYTGSNGLYERLLYSEGRAQRHAFISSHCLNAMELLLQGMLFFYYACQYF
jgi:hypothetical protein